MPEVSRLGEFKGQGFESLQARQRKALKLLKFRGFCYSHIQNPFALPRHTRQGFL